MIKINKKYLHNSISIITLIEIKNIIYNLFIFENPKNHLKQIPIKIPLIPKPFKSQF